MSTKSVPRRVRASEPSQSSAESASDGVVEAKPVSRRAMPESRTKARPDSKSIVVRGAREHNLKNIDVTIPRDQLVVITGLSGSGKSSLAFDTIFAEGQRKYMESLSAYARQFLEQLKKPDVDEVEGVPPTIAIEQRSGTGTPRSTVATTTEIYDYLRLLFARCGRPHSWAVTKAKKDGTPTARSGVPISATSSTQIVDSLVARLAESGGSASGVTKTRLGEAGHQGTRLMILAPVVRGKKGFHREVLEELTQQGWTRARVNAAIVDLRDVLKEPGENPLNLGRYEKHTIEAVVDRLSMDASPDAGSRQRLAESIEAALRLGEGGVVTVSMESPGAKGAEWRDTTYSTRFADPDHPEVALEELAPRLFSFNSPFGACPTCNGLGTAVEFDESLIVPDNSVLLNEGAIAPWNKNGAWRGWFNRKLRKFCAQFGGSMQRPIGDLTKDQRQILLYGEPDAAGGGAKPRKQSWGKRKKNWPGVIPEISEWWKTSESDNVKEFLGRFLSQKPCASCLGDRLKIEALHVLLASTHKADMKKAASEAVIGRPKHDGTMLNIAELSRLTIPDAAEFLERVVLSEEQSKIAEPILKEINNRLRFLRGVGLEYLSLDRRTATLSGGEAQRIRLASQVGSGLVGACYVLDEPTIGLHQRDNDRLIATLRHLADIGNTVLVVEHDEDMIRAADHVLDIGPGPGVHGGRVVAQGTIEEICETEGSFTGDYLSGRKSIDVPKSRRDVSESKAVVVKGASENNLKGIDVAFPLGGLVCVTGVSGSGKSTLVTDILLQSARKHITGSRVTPGKHKSVKWPKSLDRVIEVDQTPIGRTPRSNPATYTGIFDEIRKVFVTTKEAKIRGYKPGRFSFNVPSTRGGGRCEACQGQGLKKIEMHFLPDVYVECEVCRGKRYNRETLEVKYRGQSIADVLDMTVEKAVGFFENHPKIARFLKCLHDVGLDYLQLGQPSTTLSGGEAQRIKLASELGKTAGAYAAVALTSSDTDTDDADAHDSGSDDADLIELESDDEESTPTRSRLPRAGSSGSTLYILDEPTTGLHFEDIRKLVEVFDRLADAGNTLVVIEHNLDVIKRADWLIDLGPEGGEGGGRVIATGTPEAVAKAKGSHTGRYLARMLG
ncbi:MAG: excinuclease ABC subunit UvrA [Phycisphaerales bacterium]|nr:MAG: excinuclease ABC subunit UvrA [Phycisphaerales bacterium]